MMKWLMAVDQYNQTYHDLGKHPRKALLERLGKKHATRMYIDDKEGNTHHCGYSIAGLWLTLYEVQPWLNDQHRRAQ